MMIQTILYDIIKFVGSKLLKRIIPTNSEQKLLTQLDKALNERISEENKQLLNSKLWTDYFQSPQFIDIMNGYLEYITIAGYSGLNEKVREYLNANEIVTQQTVVRYLTDSLYTLYIDKEETPPEKTTISALLNELAHICQKTLIENLPVEKLNLMRFRNMRQDHANARILQNLEELKAFLLQMQTLKFSSATYEDDFAKIKEDYHKILRQKNSEAHIYLLDKFPLHSFYVPPTLERMITRRFGHAVEYYHEPFDVHWDKIFQDNHLVYLIGGAGYGKSLFSKKIINDYRDLDIFHADEYVVFFGELKNFYSHSSTPLSVTKFLKESIRINTLMDVDEAFVQYYLDSGRCIILLDALDEVDKSLRAELHETVVSFFKQQNPNNKICITSRERGFIPEKDIEAFAIAPLDRKQIEAYVDKIIALGKFEREEKANFLQQTQILLDNDFLNSFLILSLLINIYKAERELPENKLELYQKCFDYISNKREREKTSASFNWRSFSPLMKDNTFIELSRLCLPNNSDVERRVVKEELLNVYKTKFSNEADTENAIDEFLKFCSERTELFVPSAEEQFKFFHRSFFEYFYSKYIVLRMHTAQERLNEFRRFDVDSEIFELTIAMLKQHSEKEYQELLHLMFETAEKEFASFPSKLPVFSMLSVCMQVVDDVLFLEKFAALLILHKVKIVRQENNHQCLRNIENIFKNSKSLYEQICSAYHDFTILAVLENGADFIHAAREYYPRLPNDEFLKRIVQSSLRTPINRRRIRRTSSSYLQIFFRKMDIERELSLLKEADVLSLYQALPPSPPKTSFQQILLFLALYQQMPEDERSAFLKPILSEM